MARGWGRSEEDLGADREQAREQSEKADARPAGGTEPQIARRRSLELSLARIEELLTKTGNADRRRALETAKAELLERLAGLSRSSR
ncbi:MAG TPA: hypothetical protein VGL03_05580 [Thermoanaerobaculia bacterium]